MDAAVVPVKSLSEAKSRLRDAFGEEGRAAVARALLDDALSLATSVDFLEWTFVSDDPEVLARAEGAGHGTQRDPGEGLNSAVAAAVAALVQRGAGSVTVVPVDVPLAWKGDLEDLLDTGATSDIVLVPAESDGGTNALYLSPPDLITPRFGKGSLAAHLAEGEQRSLRCALLNLPRLSLDLDTPEDAAAIVARGSPGPVATIDVLRKLLA